MKILDYIKSTVFLNPFKRKPLISLICGIAGFVVGLISAIVYVAYSTSVSHFQPAIFVMMLLGALLCIPIVFTEWKFAPILPAVFFAAAFGMYINDRLIMFEEMINKIYGMMEKGAILSMVILVFVLDLIAFLATAVAAFVKEKKQ